MKWQKVKFPAYIANHYFRDKHGPCLMCGAKFRAMVSADPAGCLCTGMASDALTILPTDCRCISSRQEGRSIEERS